MIPTDTDCAPSAREAAASSLDRILRSGAFSNTLVMRTTVEPSTDHGFYQRLVFTSLRYLPRIDREIAAASTRPLRRIEPLVLASLRVAVAELRYLGTEPHAAVNEAVAALSGPAMRARGFANAVLRSIAAADDRSHEPSLRDAYPEPVIDRVQADLGYGIGTAFLEAANEPAPPGLRFRPGADESGSRYATSTDDVAALTESGSVDVIDPASTAVATALGVQPGDRIIDLAAAPGGKTRALADACDPQCLIVGMDVHPGRLRRARLRSVDVSTVHWVLGDARRPPYRDRAFDRVLLDAPCTGLGTLRRRPEIRYRFEPDAPERYGRLQREMVERAAQLVAPGGRLVYSVCTPTSAETMAVVAGLGFHAPEGLDGPPHGDGILLGPHSTGTDGMFIATLDT